MEKLDEQEQTALLDALDDEYKSWSTYDQMIRDFGIHHATLQPEPMTHAVHWREPPGHEDEHDHNHD